MAVLGELLFCRDGTDLDALLRHQADEVLRQVVDGLPNLLFASKSDDEIAAQVMTAVRIAPLVLDFTAAKADVRETTVEVTDYGRCLRVTGLRATKTIPFTGNPDLWHLRTNSYDYNPPRGEVRRSTIVVGMEVVEQQADKAVAHIGEAITRIKQYLQRQEAQLTAFDASLPAQVMPQVQQRRQRLDKAADLRRKLQG
jgi:hypothetical protein